MLDKLPPEIILMIVKNLRSKDDLRNLSEVSRRLYRYTIPELYRSFYVCIKNFKHGVGLVDNRCRDHYMQFVKSLEIGVDYYFRHILSVNYDPSYATHIMPYNIVDETCLILKNIKDHALEHFGFKIGCCIPEEVLRYLTAHQPKLPSLSIITSHCLEKYDEEDEEIDLPDDSLALTHLKRLSWKGAPRIKVLKKLLRDSAGTLEELELGDFDSVCNFKTRACDRCLLGLEFPSLHSLRLLEFPLSNNIENPLQPINFFNLRSLTIQNCPGINNLLDLLAKSNQGQGLKLTSFEIGYSLFMVSGSFDLHPLARFLRSFQGLEDLFILCSNFADFPLSYWESILCHKSTLRRFIHQQREVRLNLSMEETQGIRRLLQEISLECLGLCFELRSLPKFFSTINPRPKLKVLHVRDTGMMILEYYSFPRKIYPRSPSESDELNMWTRSRALRKFAKWAFGPDGLPDLEVLAFGDLTYENRWPNLILCRSHGATEEAKSYCYYRDNVPAVDKGTFCTLTRNIEPPWSIYEANRDMLEACPEDTLIKDSDN